MMQSIKELHGSRREPDEQEIITAYVKGDKVMMTPSEAISLINQVSGVLLAYEYNNGQKKILL